MILSDYFIFLIQSEISNWFRTNSKNIPCDPSGSFYKNQKLQICPFLIFLRIFSNYFLGKEISSILFLPKPIWEKLMLLIKSLNQSLFEGLI